MSRRHGWNTPSPSYRQWLERQGIDQASYEAGASLAQARGHPRRGERLRTEPPPSRQLHYQSPSDERIIAAVQLMRQGASLQQAAKASHVAPERLRWVTGSVGTSGSAIK